MLRPSATIHGTSLDCIAISRIEQDYLCHFEVVVASAKARRYVLCTRSAEEVDGGMAAVPGLTSTGLSGGLPAYGAAAMPTTGAASFLPLSDPYRVVLKVNTSPALLAST